MKFKIEDWDIDYRINYSNRGHEPILWCKMRHKENYYFKVTYQIEYDQSETWAVLDGMTSFTLKDKEFIESFKKTEESLPKREMRLQQENIGSTTTIKNLNDIQIKKTEEENEDGK